MTDTNPPNNNEPLDERELAEIIGSVLENGSVELDAVMQERLQATLSGSSWEAILMNPGKRFEWASQRLALNVLLRAGDDPVVHVQAAVLRLVASSVDIKDDVTALTINTGEFDGPKFPFGNLSWLSGFTNLRRLHLTGYGITDRMVASLGDLGIEELFIENNGTHVTLQSNASLTGFVGTSVAFEQDGQWPNLKTADLKAASGITALVDGSPQLEYLKHDSEPTNFTSGMGQRHREVQLVASATLKRAVLDSNFTVRDCPELTDLEIGGKVEVANTPKLRKLHLRNASVNADSGLSQLESVEEIRIERLHGEAIELPPNAKFVPLGEDSEVSISIGVDDGLATLPLVGLTHLRLRYWGNSVDVLEPLAEAPDLESIELIGNFTDLSAIANLPNLRVVDVRHSRELRDISPLVESPSLELIAISRTGIAIVPDELAVKVRDVADEDLSKPLVTS